MHETPISRNIRKYSHASVAFFSILQQFIRKLTHISLAPFLTNTGQQSDHDLYCLITESYVISLNIFLFQINRENSPGSIFQLPQVNHLSLAVFLNESTLLIYFTDLSLPGTGSFVCFVMS